MVRTHHHTSLRFKVMLHEICMAEHNCKTLSKQCCSAMQPPERQGPVLPSHLEGALMVLRGGPQSVHDGSPNVRKDTYTVVRRLSAATWASTSMRPWLPGTPPELLGGHLGSLGFSTTVTQNTDMMQKRAFCLCLFATISLFALSSAHFFGSRSAPVLCSSSSSPLQPGHY